MFCKKCGNQLKPTAKFCAKCGEKTVTQAQAASAKGNNTTQSTIFCSKCGEKTTGDRKFCPNCGNKLAAGIDTAQINSKIEQTAANAFKSAKDSKAFAFVKKNKALVIIGGAVLVAIIVPIIVFSSRPRLSCTHIRQGSSFTETTELTGTFNRRGDQLLRGDARIEAVFSNTAEMPHSLTQNTAECEGLDRMSGINCRIRSDANSFNMRVQVDVGRAGTRNDALSGMGLSSDTPLHINTARTRLTNNGFVCR